MGCRGPRNGGPAGRPSARCVVAAPFALLLAILTGTADAAEERPGELSAVLLPTEDLQAELRKLGEQTAVRSAVETAKLDLDVEAFGDGGILYGFWADKRMSSLPLEATNQIVLLLDPTLPPGEIYEVVDKYRIDAVDIDPRIGMIVADMSDRLRDDSRDATPKLDALLYSPLQKLIADMQEDNRFVAVTSNTALSPFQIESAIPPATGATGQGPGKEVVDWGLGDARIEAAWPKIKGKHLIGVLDVGFSPHEDLVFRNGLAGPVKSDAHGNHVSGIACAQHNGIGIKGALSDCTLVIATGNVLVGKYSAREGSKAELLYGLFSEVVSTVLDLLERNPDVKVVNLSLGYNWVPKLGIDPAASGNEEIRNLVRRQGRFFQSVLAYAKARNVILISAAGNDSTGLPKPLDSTWASPFNFGSQLMKDVDGWTNGIVVEAHDKNDKRADFSNIGGDISAPGVNIYSALAKSQDAYGEMSGTSMATPYVSASVAALQGLYPKASIRRLIECLLSTGETIDGRVPKLDLETSIELCAKH